jgi:YVTN family beta-propeller protein
LRRLLIVCLLALGDSGQIAVSATAPLILEAKIPLGHVEGRLDHLAIDIGRRRLYVAELGNNSVGVIDIKARRVINTIGGFAEPQGIAYEQTTDTVYISNGGDGSIKLLQGASLDPIGLIALGSDADNIQAAPATGRLIVGYGNGALGVIDSMHRSRIADITLNAHPESFRLTGDGRRIFINVPEAHEIAVVDLMAQKQVDSWPTQELGSNFPMAWGEAEDVLWVAFRVPPTLAAYNSSTGARIASLKSCGDADDIFADSKRHRLYVICGVGQIEVWQVGGNRFQRIAQLTTSAGARTALFAPDLDRLFLAVSAILNEQAAIWEFRLAVR